MTNLKYRKVIFMTDVNAMKQIRILFLAFCVIGLSIFTASCGNGDSVTTQTGTVSIGVSGQSSSSSSAISVSSSYSGPVMASMVSSATITSAKIVLGRIKIKSTMEDTLDFRTDPVIVNLDLTGVTQQIGSVQIPVGTYDEIRFRIDDLDSCATLDSCTAAEILAYENNPDMRDISIRIEGYVNGSTDSSFVWTTDLDEEQRYDVIPFTVEAGQTVNLVFEFDVSQWLSDGLGGTLDPRVAVSESIIENNLKTAFDIREEISN